MHPIYSNLLRKNVGWGEDTEFPLTVQTYELEKIFDNILFL
jgi:hypothetical protein